MKTLIYYLLALLAALSLSPASPAPEPAAAPGVIAEPSEPDEYPHSADFYAAFKQDFPDAECTLFTSEELTQDVLTARKDWDEYLVEVTTGFVLNDRGDGRADLPEPYNYISYRRVPFETKPGDRIVTYCVYEIHSNGEDDIIARYDYPLN